MLKVKHLAHLDPETVITFGSGFEGAYSAKSYSFDEGVYDTKTESWMLLSENNLTDLEEKYMGQEGLDFVSLIVLEV